MNFHLIPRRGHIVVSVIDVIKAGGVIDVIDTAGVDAIAYTMFISISPPGSEESLNNKGLVNYPMLISQFRTP